MKARPSPPSQPSSFPRRTIPPTWSRRALQSSRRLPWLHRLLPRHRLTTSRPNRPVRPSGSWLRSSLPCHSRPHFHPCLPLLDSRGRRRSSRIPTCRTKATRRARFEKLALASLTPRANASHLDAGHSFGRQGVGRIHVAVGRPDGEWHDILAGQSRVGAGGLTPRDRKDERDDARRPEPVHQPLRSFPV
jgi:hypothetical protein